MNQPTIDKFQNRVSQLFEVIDGGKPVLLKLSRVEPRRSQANMPPAFSLFFQGTGERMLDQRIHTLRHSEMGDLQIFLVPVGRGENGAFEYQAIFQ